MAARDGVSQTPNPETRIPNPALSSRSTISSAALLAVRGLSLGWRMPMRSVRYGSIAARLLWRALAQEKDTAARPLLEPLDSATADESAIGETPLPPLSPQEQVWADYQTAGLSLKAHPLSFCRAALDALEVLPATRLAEARNNGLVRVAGLVLVRQRPGTARGITFVTIEDETGTANLIIHPSIWDRYYQAARTAGALLAHGRLQWAYGVIHVVVSKLEDLGGRLRELKSQSRDFQ